MKIVSNPQKKIEGDLILKLNEAQAQVQRLKEELGKAKVQKLRETQAQELKEAQAQVQKLKEELGKAILWKDILLKANKIDRDKPDKMSPIDFMKQLYHKQAYNKFITRGNINDILAEAGEALRKDNASSAKESIKTKLNAAWEEISKETLGSADSVYLIQLYGEKAGKEIFDKFFSPEILLDRAHEYSRISTALGYDINKYINLVQDVKTDKSMKLSAPDIQVIQNYTIALKNLVNIPFLNEGDDDNFKPSPISEFNAAAIAYDALLKTNPTFREKTEQMTVHRNENITRTYLNKLPENYNYSDMYKTILKQLYLGEQNQKELLENIDKIYDLAQKLNLSGGTTANLKDFSKLPPGYPFSGKAVNLDEMQAIITRLEVIHELCLQDIQDNVVSIDAYLKSDNPLHEFLKKQTTIRNDEFNAILTHVDINEKNPDGLTPLQIAVLNDRLPPYYVDNLIKSGANLKETTTKYPRGRFTKIADAFAGLLSGNFMKYLREPPPRTASEIASILGFKQTFDKLKQAETKTPNVQAQDKTQIQSQSIDAQQLCGKLSDLHKAASKHTNEVPDKNNIESRPLVKFSSDKKSETKFVSDNKIRCLDIIVTLNKELKDIKTEGLHGEDYNRAEMEKDKIRVEIKAVKEVVGLLEKNKTITAPDANFANSVKATLDTAHNEMQEYADKSGIGHEINANKLSNETEFLLNNLSEPSEPKEQSDQKKSKSLKN
ncbi:MAG: hypothetical protein JSS07_00925 [Proteobacteria bacterium]|nr:hypothetical protein [Pseudomonadota bacterium]